MGRLFGNDGTKKLAVTELTCETVMMTGRAAAFMLGKKLNRRPLIAVGCDTRISSDTLCAALCAGLCSAGADVLVLGTVPTPAVSFLVREKKADAGIMLTASHNSMEYNAIRLFGSDGRRVGDEIEEEIERLVFDSPSEVTLKSHALVGKMIRCDDAQRLYIDHVRSSVSADLSGLTVAIDCANGCASFTAKKIFSELGAEVLVMNDEPDGCNINKNCGSSHIQNLMSFAAENSCDCGIAFDGDGSKCLAVDEKGELIDGDRLMAVIAKHMKEKDILKNNAVVVSVMTNLGFRYFAKENGIATVTAGIGERCIIGKLVDGGYSVGGEQNGSVIFTDHTLTGDGQLAAAKLLEVLADSDKPLSELADVMHKIPQVMINVRISPKDREVWKNNRFITDVIERCEKELGENGRILVRESGTEPLIRVMAEGRDFSQINDMAVEIADAIKSHSKK